MKHLFVIGNGFDRAHGLCTSYEDFREFLCEEYNVDKEACEVMPDLPEVMTGPKGDFIFDIEEAAAFLVGLISAAEPEGARWSDLEASLGRLDYAEVFDFLPEILDEDGDLDDWKTAYNNEDLGLALQIIVPDIKKFFSKWIDRIQVDKVKPKRDFKGFIDEEDLFLTFNYTETLERAYGVDPGRICHIHGKQGQEIFFGHGRNEDYTDEYMGQYIGAEDALSALDSLLRKDTRRAFKAHQGFFQRVGNGIDAVYSIGFSFGDMDLFYVKEICRRLPDQAVWYLYDYDKDKLPGYQQKIRECGFKGEFGSFHI